MGDEGQGDDGEVQHPRRGRRHVGVCGGERRDACDVRPGRCEAALCAELSGVRQSQARPARVSECQLQAASSQASAWQTLPPPALPAGTRAAPAAPRAPRREGEGEGRARGGGAGDTSGWTHHFPEKRSSSWFGRCCDSHSYTPFCSTLDRVERPPVSRTPYWLLCVASVGREATPTN